MEVIYKYPNRKIYSPKLHKYITLDEIHKMILSGKDIVVMKKDTYKNEEWDVTSEVKISIVKQFLQKNRDHIDSVFNIINQLSKTKESDNV